MTIKKGLTKLTLIPLVAFGLKGNAQVVDGWFEATKGINQGNNIRLWPAVNTKYIKASSLIDINNFFKFSKTDIYSPQLKKKLGENTTVKPVATLHTNPFENKITLDANVTRATDKYFGFFEVDINPLNAKDPGFFTYHDFKTKIANLGIFATGKFKDIKKTYFELQATGKELRKTGVSPFVRTNLQKGVKPTYQIGVSIKPRKTYQGVRK